jgi:hypothetical protein
VIKQLVNPMNKYLFWLMETKDMIFLAFTEE